VKLYGNAEAFDGSARFRECHDGVQKCELSRTALCAAGVLLGDERSAV
jgi:hypothetical protein